MSYLIAFLGAGIGGSLHHSINAIAPRLLETALLFGIILVNLTSSLMIGLIVGYLAFRGGSQATRLFLTNGILGDFTTLSAFSPDVSALLERSDLARAAIYCGLSVAGTALALFVGLCFAQTDF